MAPFHVAVALVALFSAARGLSVSGGIGSVVLTQYCPWPDHFSWPKTGDGRVWMPKSEIQVLTDPTAPVTVSAHANAISISAEHSSAYLNGTNLDNLVAFFVYWDGFLPERRDSAPPTRLDLDQGCINNDTDIILNGYSLIELESNLASAAPHTCQDYYMLGFSLFPSFCTIVDNVGVNAIGLRPPFPPPEGYTGFLRGTGVAYSREFSFPSAGFTATKIGQVSVGDALGYLSVFKDVEFRLVMASNGDETDSKIVFEISGGIHGLSLFYGPGPLLTANKCSSEDDFSDTSISVSLPMVIGKISMVTLYFAETGGKATLRLSVDGQSVERTVAGVSGRWETPWHSALWPDKKLTDNTLCGTAAYIHPEKARMDFNYGLRAKLLERR